MVEKILRVIRIASTYAARNFRSISTARFVLVRTSRLLRWLQKWAKWIQLIAEEIPFINAIPWYTMSMVFVYIDHKNSHKEAQKHIAELERLLRVGTDIISAN